MMKVILYIVSCLLLFNSCSKDSTFDGGPVIANRIDLQPFTSIEFMGVYDVTLVKDTSYFAIVTYGENLMKGLSISSINNKLTANNEQPFNIGRKYDHCQLEVHFPSLESITLLQCVSIKTLDTLTLSSLTINDHSEVCEIDMLINCNTFALGVYAESCGVFKFNGSATKSNVSLRGSANYLSGRLKTQTTTLKQNGIGDCYINATNEINGEVNNISSIYLSGNPRDSLKLNHKLARLIHL